VLNLVTFRTSNTYAQTHIVAEGFWEAFCGTVVPAPVREMWGDPRNPYVNKPKAVVTCRECIAEWQAGRKTGGRTVEIPETESEGVPTE